MTAQARRWYGALTLVSVAAFAIGVAYVLIAKRHAVATGDAYYFHYQANLIVEGKGWFLKPFSFDFHGQVVQGADHPPLWTVVLAVAAALGCKSYLSQLLWACGVGAAAVFVTGLAAREVGGPRTGLIAAAIAALYPNYWLNYGLGLAETLLLLVVATLLLVSVRMWKRPRVSTAALLGVVCALAALTRSEQVLLVLFVLVPVMLVLRSLTWRRRLALAGVGIVAALLTMAPWVGFNLSRLNEPEYLSTELGATLVAANCPRSYYGDHLGYWTLRCERSVASIVGDESVADFHDRHVALEYATAHLSRVPVVLAARLGREFGLFDPSSQIGFDHNVDARPLRPAEIGLVMYYALVVASVFGAVALRRRGVTLVPFAGVAIEVVVTALLIYGSTRFRIPLEVVLVVLTAVFVDQRVARRRGAHHCGPGDDLGQDRRMRDLTA